MICKSLIQLYNNYDDINSFLKSAKDENIFSLEGITESAFPFIIANLFHEIPKLYIIICKNNSIMHKFHDDVSLYLDSEDICPFPDYEILPYEYVSPVEKIERQRINAIYRILKKDKMVLVTTADSMLRKIPEQNYYLNKEIELIIDEEYPFDDIIESLISYGYVRVPRVEGFGEFSVKGGIIDIYPPSYSNPLRLDFFDDLLESIREFDIETQKSILKLEFITIIPRKEINLSNKHQNELTEFVKKKYIEGEKFPEILINNIENGIMLEDFNGIEDIYSVIINNVSLLEYLNNDSKCILLNRYEISNQNTNSIHLYSELYERKKSTLFALPPSNLISPDWFDEIKDCSYQLNSLVITPESIRPDFKSNTSFQGKISKLREDLSEKLNNNWNIIIITAFEGQARRLADILKEFSPDTDFYKLNLENNINIVLASYSSGFINEKLKLCILTDHDIFGKSYKRKKTFKSKKSSPISSYLDLEVGDYIVHINHGIGLFKEIQRMSAGGIEKDFIVIEYADTDKLFVALDQLNMIQKYIGFEGKKPRIDNLGKKSAWNRIKDRVKKSIEEIAEELISVYAKRKMLKGIRFPEDTVWQEEFEANFEYEETPDQLSAIEDVKNDMESSQPMDRLICGDVGFGKTEVAIRASFKSAMAGMQTAILVPTTILAMQHYNTFVKRFKDYPVTIGIICRFRTRKDINETKAKLAGGNLDIVIGTHALLSDDVFFKNIGLLIIDEEQKFGVKHKEKIKKIRTHIDVLTLSATPIPRTLHMSMAGIRDLSTIMTPPENRQSIETYVLEENPDILKMAISNEMDRGGQIFFIHNRVQTIETQYEMLSELVPEATIAIAHGQMPEHELEEIMIDFMENKYNILISTTIIESGLDMPHVNTIIINRSDTFGLSQLYQLKGRVGRSNLKGYAYFFYPKYVALSETAQKRLKVISEFSDLGSGFKIAMKDLEIRGSGNILGREQSGNIMDVGFDLYCQMLEDTVNRLKGEKYQIIKRTPIFMKVDTFIPDDYIPDQKQKIEFYKKFESCETVKEIDTILDELTDRFGNPPKNINILVDLEKIRTEATSLQIDEIIEGEKSIRLRITSNSNIKTEKLLNLINSNERLLIDPNDNEILIFRPENNESEKKLLELKKLLLTLG